ncbi:hypothetical protein ACVW0K_007413 [Streptomyces filamentosus]
MENGSANPASDTKLSVLFQPRRWNPAGDFTATYVSTRAGWRHGVVHPDHIDSICHEPLAGIHHDFTVVITGLVEEVFLQGTGDSPRAMVILDSDTGAQTILDFERATYARYWGHLVLGHTLRITGQVKRPKNDRHQAINTGPMFIRVQELNTEAGV